MFSLDTRKLAQPFEAKLKEIQLALFDIDGVMTDGHITYYGEELGFNRTFNIQDGYGIKLLQRMGIKVGIISGGASEAVKMRFRQLKVDYLYLGSEHKVPAFEEILDKSRVSADHTLYIGDDFFDLPVLKRVGLSVCPPHASIEIREQVDYITQREAGKACVREVIDMIRHARGYVPEA